eukprot:GHUV01011368.1.p1 GENE.GHUV01011368.1~~GHUV01011368.1.p1  ORF type:complete len:166 (+),score=48.12 GHUV01011368.1:132-629(+)
MASQQADVVPEVQDGATHAAAASPVAAAAKGAVRWTAVKVVASCGIFILAGLAEIGGGWLVWQTVRNKKPWYYILTGFIVLMAYGLIPTLQPQEASFSRVYAVYGGIFVVMSYGWGWAVDGDRPDLGDIIGACIALAGVCLCWFWPRKAVEVGHAGAAAALGGSS